MRQLKRIAIIVILIVNVLSVHVLGGQFDLPARKQGESSAASVASSLKYNYLFVGNSMTFYNNMPEMFSGIVYAATGKRISYQTLLYGGRDLETHGYAIKAVMRTNGDASKLTREEKTYFAKGKEMTASNYNQGVYDAYKNALMDGSGRIIRYDHIILQEFAKNTSLSKMKNGADNILGKLSTSNTKVVICMPYYYYQNNMSLYDFVKTQNGHDRRADSLKAYVEKKYPNRSVKVAYTGRAVCNYLARYGMSYAQKKYAADYKVYEKNNRFLYNDIVLEDSLHPTQLGTYLFASTLYNIIYKQNAVSTIHDFRGYTKTTVPNLRYLNNGNNYAALNGNLSASLVKKAANVTYDTQCRNQRLTVSKPVSGNFGWVKKSGKWYFYNAYGTMISGFRKILGKWYYLKTNGVMATGWLKVKGLWYYFCEDGSMQTGWKRLGGSWFYFKPGNAGHMVTGWQKIGNYWYYFRENGRMLTGRHKIQNRWYSFAPNGIWIG